MALSLAEQLLLVAFDEKRGRAGVRGGIEAGLAGALLLDLERQELIAADEDGDLVTTGKPRLLGHFATSDPLLRDAADFVAKGGVSRSPTVWVWRLQQELSPLSERAGRGLVQAGVLAERPSPLSRIRRRTRFSQVKIEPRRRLRRRLEDVLLQGARPTEDEALVLGLLQGYGLIKTLVPRDRRAEAVERSHAVVIGGPESAAVSAATQAALTAILTATLVSGMHGIGAGLGGGDGGGGGGGG